MRFINKHVGFGVVKKMADGRRKKGLLRAIHNDGTIRVLYHNHVKYTEEINGDPDINFRNQLKVR